MNETGNNPVLQHVLSKAAREIRQLRREVVELRIRVKAFDDIIACLDKRPHKDTGPIEMTQDVAWELEQIIKEGK